VGGARVAGAGNGSQLPPDAEVVHAPPPPSAPAPSPALPGNGRQPRQRPAVHIAGDDAVPRGLAVSSAIIVRLAIVLGGLYLLGALALKLLVLVVPLVCALLLATLFEPPARYLRIKGWKPATAALASVGGGLIAFLAVLTIVLPPFAQEAGELGSTLEQGVRELGDAVANGPFGVTEAQINRSIDQVTSSFEGSSGSVIRGVLSGALLVTQWLAGTLLTLFLTFFFVKDGRSIWAWIVRLFSLHRRLHVHEMGIRSWRVLTAYVRGAALVATIDAVLIGIALVAVGVPLVLPLVSLTFIAAFFPIVGALAAGAAAVLVALVANGLGSALIVLAAIIVIQQLEGNVFYPVVVGRQLNLHPIVMLTALTAGGVLAGIAGAFLAVPLAAVIGAIMEYSREPGTSTGPEAGERGGAPVAAA
jgi:predicted PurR-regulated permease PerM